MRTTIAIAFLTVLFSPALRPQTPRDVMQTFANRQFILFHSDGNDKIRLKKGRLNRESGPCDLAVEVHSTSWDNGKVSLLLENIGTAHLANGATKPCPRMTETTTLEISGFAVDEPAALLTDSMRQVLKTPEEYLAANGIRFDYPPAPDDQNKEIAAKPPPPIAHPELLLGVDGSYSEAARKQRLNGSVTMKVLVGTDGRIHDAHIFQGLGNGLDENALRVLPMWRFTPAHQGDHPVARPATISMNFKII